ncbi:MAG: sigma 54 modulation/S30EA ribosomal C-terminal domain-containing protein [Actinomycetota bacterium]
MTAQPPEIEVVVHVVGQVSAADREYAVTKLEHARRLCPGPVLFARLELREERDPARARPSTAKAEIDCNGRLVRAHVAAPTMHEAVDPLDTRLRQSIERVVHHDRDARLRHRDGESWHHGDAPTRRPAYYPRPAEDRAVVVRKSFAVAAESVDEAVADLELLDHDFFLFRDVTNEVDCVVRRVDDGYELHCAGPPPDEPIAAPVRHRRDPVPSLALEDAEELLDASDLELVFFVAPDTGRGRVLYRRYDGHYGLIVAIDDAATA